MIAANLVDELHAFVNPIIIAAAIPGCRRTSAFRSSSQASAASGESFICTIGQLGEEAAAGGPAAVPDYQYARLLDRR
jgi:hypothetical protein